MLTQEQFREAITTLERLASTYNEGTTRGFFHVRRGVGDSFKFDLATLRIVSSPTFFLHHAMVLWGICNTLGGQLSATAHGDTSTWEISVNGECEGAPADDEALNFFDGGTR